MAKAPRLIVNVQTKTAETPHDTFVTEGDVPSYQGRLDLPGIGEGLGRLVGGTIGFRIESLTQAITYGTVGFGLYDISFTSLDVAAAVEFTPVGGGARFEPVLISHFEAGQSGIMAAGVGNPFNYFSVPSESVPLRGLTASEAADGWSVAFDATSMATPYVDGVPNPTGVFGGLLSKAGVDYEFAPATYGGGRDVVRGGAGTDAVALGGGADVFRGGGGRDAAAGQGGHDRLIGQGGDDRMFGNGGRDTLLGGRGDDDLHGGGGRDLLKGGRGRDELDGGGGRDRLLGGKGDDELKGGKGRDVLDGGRGGDALFGGAGRDRLVDGHGDDEMAGGRGVDWFDFRKVRGDNQVLDFEVGVDRIVLTAALAADWREGLTPDYTNEDGVGVVENEAKVKYFIGFDGVTVMSDVLDAILVL